MATHDLLFVRIGFTLWKLGVGCGYNADGGPGHVMEVYYKDLISEDASLEKLVDDLSLVVQGAEEFAEAAGEGLHPDRKLELASRLSRLKEGYRKIRGRAAEGAVATDKVLRRYPYSFAGAAFALGMLAGVLVCRSTHSRQELE